ncbi:MAG: hypothetical protein JRG85_13800 [Deltaproteobacteria bacterium]|nr:hypothetical protein [Deltaproteobacteria bacterium]
MVGGLIGDCNGIDGVTIDEVQTVINIFLGDEPLATCPAADASGDGTVDITEMQNAMNNHLQITP